ncbi:unannotated protein [freshwater metagenome]|uniref:Unannotated protein n=1 Tax=freshwater metagenome TaxID=449393 RepID=A0A6J7DIH1_9ZZZZ
MMFAGRRRGEKTGVLLDAETSDVLLSSWLQKTEIPMKVAPTTPRAVAAIRWRFRCVVIKSNRVAFASEHVAKDAQVR